MITNAFDDVTFANNPASCINLAHARKGDNLVFTYDDKLRDVIVDRVGKDYLCGNCRISGGFRNFRFEKIQNARVD